MIIYRVVNGKTYCFELTDDELSAAYFEQQHKWDVEFVKEHAESHVFSQADLDYIADEMRRNIRKCCADFEEALESIIRIIRIEGGK